MSTTWIPGYYHESCAVCPECDSDMGHNSGCSLAPAAQIATLTAQLSEARAVVEAAADLALFEADCGDTSCHFATKKTGMRTNGGCRCLRDIRVKFECPSRNGIGLGSFEHRMLRLRSALHQPSAGVPAVADGGEPDEAL